MLRVLGEGDEPVDACGEGGVVGHVDVDAAWVHGVAGEEQTGLPVVDRDRRLVMAGGGDDVQHPAAQVVAAEVG